MIFSIVDAIDDSDQWKYDRDFSNNDGNFDDGFFWTHEGENDEQHKKVKNSWKTVTNKKIK